MSEPKRFKNRVKLLEDLPNELMVEILNYLNGVDSVYAFSKLNYRFEGLLSTYVQSFNFQSISKAKFHLILQKHDIRSWKSLCLSNDDETPTQIQCFFQLFPTTGNIDKIESLKLLNMQQHDSINILPRINSFKNLVSLSIGKLCGFDVPAIELPALKIVSLNSCRHTSWLMNFPNLETVELKLAHDFCSHSNNLILPQTVKDLQIYCYYEDPMLIQTMLRQMSNIRTLALYISTRHTNVLDGKIWEDLIVSSLPFLKTFTFFFKFLTYYNTIHVDLIIKSFSTPFYLYEKNWFIQCNYDTTQVTLYSLPFSFSTMDMSAPSFNKNYSTMPTDYTSQLKPGSRVKINKLILSKQYEPSQLDYFALNISHLVLVDTKLTSNWFYLLNNVRCLEIIDGTKIETVDFAQMLQHLSNLESLTVSACFLKRVTENYKNQMVCLLLFQRIRRLSINRKYGYSNDLGIVSVRDLASLARVFCSKCQHLSLGLAAKPTTIWPILRRFKQLRSLHINWYFGVDPIEESISSWPWFQRTNYSEVLHNFYIYSNSSLFVWFGDRF